VEIVRCKPSATNGANGWVNTTKKKINECLREVARHLVQGRLLLSEEPDNINSFTLNDMERCVCVSECVRMCMNIFLFIVSRVYKG
jgi:predicted molibdopterin-dependent oxidoreductase YjgC